MNLPLIVIIPTYCEEKNVIPVAENIFVHNPDCHILFVDDNSPDQTKNCIEKLQKRYPDTVFLLNRPKKEGIGPAYLSGFDWVLKRNYQLIAQMDADLSHRSEDLKQMVCNLSSFDGVIGSRYTNGGGTKNWSALRLAVSRFGSFYSQLCLGCSYKDFTGGFNLWRRQSLECIDLKSVKSSGYMFQVEMKYRAFKAGLKLKEVPITFVERQNGKSKMSLQIVLEAVVQVPLLKRKV